MAGAAHLLRQAHRHDPRRRAGPTQPGRPRPVVPRRSAARRLPRHRGARRPDRARQPAASRPRRAAHHHRRRRRRAAPPHRRRGPRRRKPGGRRRPPAAAPAGAPPLPRDGAVLRPHRPARAQRHVLHGGRPGLRRRGRARPAVAARWAAVHALGPVLLAAFANSPRLHGRRTGWKSTRWAAWLRADPARTAPPADPDPADPAAAWARRVLDAPVLCVRGDGSWLVPEGLTFAAWVRGGGPARRPIADLDYHVSTLFPPVRPRGHLEVRYVDMQPGRRWALPVAVLAALLSDPGVIDVVRNVCAPAARPVGVGRPPRAGRPRARPSGRPGVRAGGRRACPMLGRPDVAHRRARRHDRTARPARPVPRRRAGRSAPCDHSSEAAVARGVAHPYRRPPRPPRGPAARRSPTPSTRPTSSHSTRR